MTQQRMNQWLILQITPGHWLQSSGSEFLILESGERNPHPPASVFFFSLSVLSAICSPLSPHSRSIANPSLGQFTCRL